MNPIKIVRAKNGYILEVQVGNNTEHYIISKFADVITTLENHFKDEEYINWKMEQARLANVEEFNNVTVK